MDMSHLPEVTQQDYHRLSGLHYTSSFSDAEDCCDDITSSSSSSDYIGIDCWHLLWFQTFAGYSHIVPNIAILFGSVKMWQCDNEICLVWPN